MSFKSSLCDFSEKIVLIVWAVKVLFWSAFLSRFLILLFIICFRRLFMSGFTFMLDASLEVKAILQKFLLI